MRHLILNISVFLGTLLFCFGLFELLLRAVSPDEAAPVRALMHVDANDPLAFETNSVGEYTTSEFDVSIEANQYGRRDVNWTPDQLADSSNILFVGDSFVLGYGVDDKHTVPSILEELEANRSRDIEVFNFGMGGGVSLPEYKKLLVRALDMDIKAQTVIIGIFVGNDFTRNQIVVDQRVMVDVAIKESVGVNRALGGPKDFLRSLKSYQFVRDRVKSSPIAIDLILRLGDAIGVDLYDSPSSYLYLEEYSEDQLNDFYGILEVMLELQEIGEAHNRDMYFVVFPNKIQVENHEALKNTASFNPDKPNELITGFCNHHNLRCLDLLPVARQTYEQDREPLYFPIDRHANVKGNTLFAESVFEYIHSF